MMNRKKALWALGALMLFGASLAVFILAADEQSIASNSSATPERISLKDLPSHNRGRNKHVEATGFYFGKPYIYTTKLVQFNEVYVPMFPNGAPESASNLQALLWIRNDRNSNEPLIQSEQELDRFVEDFSRNPRPVTGVLQTPLARVRSLTTEAYPGVNAESLLVLWARHLPNQKSVNILWSICALCLLGAVSCVFAYRRSGR
jgi:hypothetical protein